MNHQFTWTDVETTGLNAAVDLLLEIAVVLAEDGPGGSCAPVDAFTAVVAVDFHETTAGLVAKYRGLPNWLGVADLAPVLDPYVATMHTDNGLIDECRSDDAKPLSEVDRDLAAWLVERGATKRSCMLAGNSVHFDLGFCRAHLPITAALLSHRVGDVTAMRLGWEAAGGAAVPNNMPENHRALDDIVASLQNYAGMRAVWAGGIT